MNVAKIGISIFSNAFNADISDEESESHYEVVELLKNIILKITTKAIPTVYLDIINDIINEFRKVPDKSDSFYVPTEIRCMIFDILDVSQTDIHDCKDKNIEISMPKRSNLDMETLFKELKERFHSIIGEYCAKDKNPVKPESLKSNL